MQTFPFEASKKMQWVRVRGWKTEGNGVEGNLPLPFPHRSTPWMGSHLQCRLAHALFKSFSKVAQSKVIWGWHPSLYIYAYSSFINTSSTLLLVHCSYIPSSVGHECGSHQALPAMITKQRPGLSVMSETLFDLAQIHELNTSLCSITFPLTCTHSMCLLFLSMEVVVGFRQSHGRQASVAVWMSGREGAGAFHRSWLGFDVMRGDGVFFLDLFYCANERVLLVVFDDGDSCG